MGAVIHLHTVSHVAALIAADPPRKLSLSKSPSTEAGDGFPRVEGREKVENIPPHPLPSTKTCVNSGGGTVRRQWDMSAGTKVGGVGGGR